MPIWLLGVIEQSPVVFLASSVVCFLLGLLLFAWSSDQAQPTKIVAASLTTCASISLTVVLLGFSFERWSHKLPLSRNAIDETIPAATSHGATLRHRVSQFTRRLSRNLGHIADPEEGILVPQTVDQLPHSRTKTSIDAALPVSLETSLGAAALCRDEDALAAAFPVVALGEAGIEGAGSTPERSSQEIRDKATGPQGWTFDTRCLETYVGYMWDLRVAPNGKSLVSTSKR